MFVPVCVEGACYPAAGADHYGSMFISVLEVSMGYPALLVGGCEGRVGGGGVILGPCLPAPRLTGMLVPSGVSGWVLLGSLGLPVLGASRLPEAALDSGLSFLLIPTWAQAPEEVVGLPVVSVRASNSPM